MKRALLAAAFALVAAPAFADNGSDGVPRSSQSYPTGSTATPSGHSPGQGAGQSGSATADMHGDAAPGSGHRASTKQAQADRGIADQRLPQGTATRGATSGAARSPQSPWANDWNFIAPPA